MPQIEELEMVAHRAQLNSDVRDLVDQYRAIFGWDVGHFARGVGPTPLPRTI